MKKKELTTKSQINKLSGLENVVAQAQQTLNTELQYVGSFDINSTIIIIIITDDIEKSDNS